MTTPRVRQYALEAAEKHRIPADFVIRSCPHVHHKRRRLARMELIGRLRADGFSCGQIGKWLGCTQQSVEYWVQRIRRAS